MATETLQIPIVQALYNAKTNIQKAYDGNLSTYFQNDPGAFGNPENSAGSKIENTIEQMYTFLLNKSEINKIPINSIITEITYKITFSRRTSTSGGVPCNIWCGLGYSDNGSNAFNNQHNLTGFQKFADNGDWQKLTDFTQNQTKIREHYDTSLDQNPISQISSTFLTSQYPILCYTNSQSFWIYDIQVFLTYEPAPSSNIYVGNKQVQELYVGNKKASAVYLGTTKIL